LNKKDHLLGLNKFLGTEKFNQKLDTILVAN